MSSLGMPLPYPPEYDREEEAREAAYEALKTQVSEADVAEAVEQRLLALWNARHHPLAQALRDVMANPAESPLELGYIDHLPAGYLMRIGRAWVKLCAESWIHVADRVRDVAF